ncbi:hypothetical protein LMTR3_08465 [Bradyrhizobium sp. LMTR 3]|nr:hypothetical protein LMTR3_08465 [Bradyrhizobium sp. LMTR 3]
MLVATACAEVCNFLPPGTSLRDGQLFYRTAASGSWTEMPEAGVNLAGQHTSFAYVVSETIEDQRAGVVILKFGRTRQPDEPQVDRSQKRVRLLRYTVPFDNGTCRAAPAFGGESVSAKNYDDYHDAGKSGDEDATLGSFHFTYAARRGGCRETNSRIGDSIGFRSRSNRGQFSFDMDVVDRGTYWQPLLYVGITTALASSENLQDQSVETKQYRVAWGQPSCIRFRHKVPARAGFLRINDLEGLSSGGYQGPVRAPERRWLLSSP